MHRSRVRFAGRVCGVIGTGSAAALLVLAGCASERTEVASVADGGREPAVLESTTAPSGEYFEVEHDGRVYVVGSAKSLADFRATHHLAYTQTLLGYGTKGMTVVFEIDPKNEALQQRLRGEFDARHRYYAEERRDGRIYVIGEARLHEEFRQTGHLPYTSSKIGKGPGRETLVFQVDPKDERLLRRLEREFATRHGMP